MEIQQAEFRGSFPNVNKCPEDTRPEFAFIGRSNVGKSSLINMLTNRKEIAHTSKKPGKTQMINYYLVNQQWHLVDLPGYGYAKRAKTTRAKWRKMLQDYLVKRSNLVCTFILIDANVTPQENDLDFINWMGEMRLPFLLVFTKVDRLKPAEQEENIQLFRQTMLESWEELPRQFITSSHTGEGRSEMLEYIESLREDYLPYI
ncbi:MAG TPA: ribosome biogenesis GTP-binding protein YihA/YsxC [Saprospiraceae bacterium]|nr:ribosome biogenesis GTP-binding protein YihA/YsxC [Saprospiraceae bacterium]